MVFQFGGFELMIVLIAAAIAAILWLRNRVSGLAAAAAPVCLALAALLTPADLASLGVLAVAFGIVLLLGRQLGINRAKRSPQL